MDSALSRGKQRKNMEEVLGCDEEMVPTGTRSRSHNFRAGIGSVSPMRSRLSISLKITNESMRFRKEVVMLHARCCTGEPGRC